MLITYNVAEICEGGTYMKKFILIIMLIGIVIFPVEAASNKKYIMPAVVVSAGQGGGHIAISSVAKMFNLYFDYSFSLNYELLKQGVGIPTVPRGNYFLTHSELPLRTKYKTIIFEISYQLQNHIPMTPYFYESSIVDGVFTTKTVDLDGEVKRIEEIISWAKGERMDVIGIFYDYSDKMQSQNIYMPILELIVPNCDIMILPENCGYKQIIKNMHDNVIEFAATIDLLRFLNSIFGLGDSSSGALMSPLPPFQETMPYSSFF